MPWPVVLLINVTWTWAGGGWPGHDIRCRRDTPRGPWSSQRSHPSPSSSTFPRRAAARIDDKHKSDSKPRDSCDWKQQITHTKFSFPDAGARGQAAGSELIHAAVQGCPSSCRHAAIKSRPAMQLVQSIRRRRFHSMDRHDAIYRRRPASLPPPTSLRARAAAYLELGILRGKTTIDPERARQQGGRPERPGR